MELLSCSKGIPFVGFLFLVGIPIVSFLEFPCFASALFGLVPSAALPANVAEIREGRRPHCSDNFLTSFRHIVSFRAIASVVSSIILAVTCRRTSSWTRRGNAVACGEHFIGMLLFVSGFRQEAEYQLSV